MVQFIRHRVNKITELANLQPPWGAEIDLRSSSARPGFLHLSHDPWVEGDDFEAWAREYKKRGCQGPIILNTKEDGLEERILDILRMVGLTNFFFLDTAFPTLVKWTVEKGEKRMAVRFSAYETMETVRPFRGLAQWCWADCFSGVPPKKGDLAALRKDFQVCLVSPELQGKPVDAIKYFLPLLPVVDAVCTKRPDLWKPQ